MLVSPERLGSTARQLIEDTKNELFLSAGSSWEIAIKYASGRLDLPSPPEVYVPDRMRKTGVRGLGVTHLHALRTSSLPPHHRDPFDRLLIAQAQIESVPIVSSDPLFDRYDVQRIDAG